VALSVALSVALAGALAGALALRSPNEFKGVKPGGSWMPLTTAPLGPGVVVVALVTVTIVVLLSSLLTSSSKKSGLPSRTTCDEVADSAC